MILVEIYSKDDCHLCDIAKSVLITIQQQHPFTLQEVKIHKGDEYFENFKERIPVIYINKEFAYQHRVPEKDFLIRLQQSEKTR